MWLCMQSAAGLGGPDEVGKQVKDAAEEGLQGIVELDNNVHHVLQALCAGLIQPGVQLFPPPVICECCCVCDLHVSRTVMLIGNFGLLG